MTEFLDNVTIEVIVTVKQKSDGWIENTLASARNSQGGTVDLDNLHGDVREVVDGCLGVLLKQLQTTNQIKRLEAERKILIERGEKGSDE